MNDRAAVRVRASLFTGVIKNRYIHQLIEFPGTIGSGSPIVALLVGDRFDRKPYAVAVGNGRQSLVDLLNEAIKTLKATGEIGRLLSENIAG